MSEKFELDKWLENNYPQIASQIKKESSSYLCVEIAKDCTAHYEAIIKQKDELLKEAENILCEDYPFEIMKKKREKWFKRMESVK